MIPDELPSTACQAAMWSPPEKGYSGSRLREGGGWFGPQYVYSSRQSELFRGQYPYTEFIEAAVDEAVYIFGVIIGMPRGAGAIVGIKAKDTKAEPGSSGEWVSLYQGAPLTGVFLHQLEDRGANWNWAPTLCRTDFKTDTIRIEMDTSSLTTSAGASEWHYIDYVEVLGSRSIQTSAIPQGSFSQRGVYALESLRVLYVPDTHANGDDFFEYQASDCAGDAFRASQTGVVSFSIAPVNDVPLPVMSNLSLTAGIERSTTVSELVSDVETRVNDLVFFITE